MVTTQTEVFYLMICDLLLIMNGFVFCVVGNQKQQQILVVKGNDCLELLKVDSTNGMACFL